MSLRPPHPTSTVQPQQRRPAGRAPPGASNRFPRGQAGQSCASTRLQKVPHRLQRLASGCERKIKRRRETPGSLTHRSRRRGRLALGAVCAAAAAAAARASLWLAPQGRLRLPPSPAAHGVVTPRSVSAARGGAGKWLPAGKLRSSSPSSAGASSLGAAVPGGGVAGVRAERRAGVNACGGGGGRRAPLQSPSAVALRRVGA